MIQPIDELTPEHVGEWIKLYWNEDGAYYCSGKLVNYYNNLHHDRVEVILAGSFVPIEAEMNWQFSVE